MSTSGPTFHWESTTGYTPRRPLANHDRLGFQQHLKRELTDTISCASWLRPYDRQTFVSYDDDTGDFSLNGTLARIPEMKIPEMKIPEMNSPVNRFIARLSCDQPPIPHDQRAPIDLLWVIHVDSRMYWHDWITYMVESVMTENDRLSVILMANEPIVFQEWTYMKQWAIERRREWYDELTELSCPWSTLTGEAISSVIQATLNQITPSALDTMSDDFGRLHHVMWYCSQFSVEWFLPLQSIPTRWSLMTRTPIPHNQITLPECQWYVVRNSSQVNEAIRETPWGWIPHVQDLTVECPAEMVVTDIVSPFGYHVEHTDHRYTITVKEWGYHQPAVLYMVGTLTDDQTHPSLSVKYVKGGFSYTSTVNLTIVSQPGRLLSYHTLYCSWELYEIIKLWQTVAVSPELTEIKEEYLSVDEFDQTATQITVAMTLEDYLPLMNERVAPVCIAECTEWLQHVHRWTRCRLPETWNHQLVFWSDWITLLMTTEFVWVRDWWTRFRQKRVEYQEDLQYEQLQQTCQTKGIVVPNEFLCPITRSLLRSPVVASDGFTYEEKAIRQWFRQPLSSGLSRSPMTNQVLLSDTIYPNHALRHVLQTFYESIRNTNSTT